MSDQRAASAPPNEEVLERIVSMVEDIVRPMLACPEKLRSETSKSGDITVYRLSVSPEDLGKITGRAGRIAESLQAVVRALSVRYSREILLEIIPTK